MSTTTCGMTCGARVRGAIRAQDVIKLRRGLSGDGRPATPAEAEALFAIHDACPVQDPAWSSFFVQALSEYVVDQAQPRGYMTAEKSAWLARRITSGGIVKTRTEFALLLAVLERARWSPPSLVRLALDQVRAAFVSGEGPVRSSRAKAGAGLSADEVALARRILLSFGSEGRLAVTRTEADVLTDLNALTAAAGNHASWHDLLAKAMASAIMAAAGYAVPPRAVALAPAEIPSDARLDGPMTVSAAVAASLAGVWPGYRQQTAEEQAIARLELQRLEIVSGERCETVDPVWLAVRLAGALQPAENISAIMAYLREQLPDLPPLFRDALRPAPQPAATASLKPQPAPAA